MENIYKNCSMIILKKLLNKPERKKSIINSEFYVFFTRGKTVASDIKIEII